MVHRERTRNAEVGTRNGCPRSCSAFPVPRSDFGFTLLELLVALTIAGVVVLFAHRLFAAAGEAGRHLRVTREALDRQANARRWLAATFLSLDVGLDGAAGFDGVPDRVAFTAWELTSDGWLERRRIALGRDRDRLVARVSPGEPIVLGDSVADVAFDYLLEIGAEAPWVRQWISPVSAPVAVRLRIAKTGCGMRGGGCVVDALLFLVKERG